MELLNVFQHSVLNSVVKGYLTTGSFQKEFHYSPTYSCSFTNELGN